MEENLEQFLACVSAAINAHGWVSKKQAWDYDKLATADIAMDSMKPMKSILFMEQDIIIPDKEDLNMAKDVIFWCRTELSKKVKRIQYQDSIVEVCKEDTFDVAKYGLLASIFYAYHLDYEWKLKQKEKQAEYDRTINSVWQGIKKERMVRDVEIMRVTPWKGSYGITGIHKMIDTNGNVYTWFASPTAKWLTEGSNHTIVGTVGDHTEYNGIKQTQLKRVTVRVNKRPNVPLSEL